MQKYRLPVVYGLLLAFSFLVSSSPALAPTPGFTITASNVTMSNGGSSGVGSSTVTLTSVNGYTGTVGVTCGAPTEPAEVNVPVCNLGGPAFVILETLTANQVVTGTIGFFNTRPPCNPCPVSLPRRGGHGLAQGLALAGVLLLGFGIRRRAARWLTLTLLATGTLAGLVGISACGGNNSVVTATPGTYAYTLTAVDEKTAVAVSTTINVTVP
jgi:hypothetical protein